MNEMEVLAKHGELVTQEAPTPQELLLAARDAARALKSVIDSNDRPPVSFNGKQYLEYPHWQTIAKFYHCSVATEGAEFVEIQGIPGFKARAKVIDEKTGIVIGSAEAYCLKDEPNWKNKPMFQLASMAQTRAGAKSLANKFRYVAIVAGYEPTPKEEMDGVDLKPTIQMPKEKNSPPRNEAQDAEAQTWEEVARQNGPQGILYDSPAVPVGLDKPKAARKVITAKQVGLIHFKAKEKGVTEEALHKKIKLLWNLDSTKDLDWKQMEQLLELINAHGKA